MIKSNRSTRRLFLSQMAALGSLKVAAPFALNLAALGSAAAVGASDYKALVCLFLFGGNDSFNMFLPTDAISWTNYTTIRNQAPDSIALKATGTSPDPSAPVGSPARLGGVRPILPATRRSAPGGGVQTFALHPQFQSLQDLFNSGKRLAILSNVGPLIAPTNKTQYDQPRHQKPAQLFSHNDQQNTWQSFATEGGKVGWGGRMADLIASQNTNHFMTSISVSGNAVWLSGEQTRQYQISSGGAIKLGVNNAGRIFNSTDVGAAMDKIVRSSRSNNHFEKDLASIYGRSIDAEKILSGALKSPSDPLFGTPPTSGNYDPTRDPKLSYIDPLTGTTKLNNLARQFQMVARMMDARTQTGIGANRQIFFVSLGGFDTHDNQNTSLANLYAQIDHALAYFDTTLGGLGLRNNVTTFTASDFGRTFTSNGDGTDHGWGSHHLIMGGAVKGGDIYGQIPILGTKNSNNNFFDSSPDQLSNGSLLPTTSVDQYAATMGKWFGLSDGQLLDILPNLNRFSTKNMGFML